MELLNKLNWIDLVDHHRAGGGRLCGYTQGTIRYVLSGIVVVVAFVLASQLKGPITDALASGRRHAELKELWIFIVLFIAFMIAGWFIVRAFYRRTRLPSRASSTRSPARCSASCSPRRSSSSSCSCSTRCSATRGASARRARPRAAGRIGRA